MLCLPTSWRVSSQLLHPNLLPCTVQATPLLPISSIFGLSSHGNSQEMSPAVPQADPNTILLHLRVIPCFCEWQTCQIWVLGWRKR